MNIFFVGTGLEKVMPRKPFRRECVDIPLLGIFSEY
jgi:hypothetical protein